MEQSKDILPMIIELNKKKFFFFIVQRNTISISEESFNTIKNLLNFYIYMIYDLVNSKSRKDQERD